MDFTNQNITQVKTSQGFSYKCDGNLNRCSTPVNIKISNYYSSYDSTEFFKAM